MPKKTPSIPVNTLTDDSGSAISIGKIAAANLHTLVNESETSSEDVHQAHRHDRHSFFLLEKGTVCIEIDFQTYVIEPMSVIYMHPDQIHRMITFENVAVSSWAIDNENLNAEYVKLLEDIAPAIPLVLEKATFSLLSEAVSLGIKYAERKSDKLHHLVLKDSCNALVAIVISQYLNQSQPAGSSSRFELTARNFRTMLERHYRDIKRPAGYAQKLNLSVPYLNECVRKATGYPVTHHIQQRVILEAKRLLSHSDLSVKEIAAALGYDDYPYFTRLFSKVTGMTAQVFRNKNRG